MVGAQEISAKEMSEWIFISSPDLSPKLWTHVSNYLLNISKLIPHRNFKLDISQTQPFIP